MNSCTRKMPDGWYATSCWESDEFRFAYQEARRTVYICSLGLALAKASSKNTSVFIFKACSLKPSITVLGVGICEDLQVTERYLQYAKNAMYYDKKYWPVIFLLEATCLPCNATSQLLLKWNAILLQWISEKWTTLQYDSNTLLY